MSSEKCCQNIVQEKKMATFQLTLVHNSQTPHALQQHHRF